jgi:alkanesulfonate monooxygenase SsuD/methylene tetrahydromethanopterin reductase-like flavin-dependent oxidoreductase (luciferase family)
VAGALDHAIIERVAVAAEAAGYRTLWANDTPGGEGLAALAAAARVTARIRLGVGVIPVDRTPADRIAARVRELKIPQDRLVLGIGAGAMRRGSVPRVEEAVLALKALVSCPVVVGALGPRMCELGGRVADGVLLNWLTPVQAAVAAESVRAAAREAGRPRPEVAAYVRVALPEARAKLEAEAERYERFPSYAAHFARMGVRAVETAVIGDPAAIQHGLSAFDSAVDEVVVRAVVPEERHESYLALVEAARPQ